MYIYIIPISISLYFLAILLLLIKNGETMY